MHALSGTQKAALLLIQIGREQAARVMARLDESEIEELTTEIARLERVDAGTAQEVIDEFYEASIGGSGPASYGGIGFAQQVLEASVGRERAAGMLERLATSLQGQPFEFLQYADARQVVGLLSGEHPQTIALVMAHLRPDHASAILTGLPPGVQADVAHRIALMERASPDVVAGRVEQVYELFPRLRDLEARTCLNLSGGEKQMVAIGRGLMAAPKLLLMDEPSLGLAPLIVREMFRVIREIAARGTTVLLVEQNTAAAFEVARYGYVLETGTVALEGPAEELRVDPHVKQAYLGL